jgi:hypothetical protein
MIRINMFPASLTGLGRDGWGDDFQEKRVSPSGRRLDYLGFSLDIGMRHRARWLRWRGRGR